MLVPPGIHERLCLFSNQQLQRVENTGSVDQCAINIKSQRLFHIQGGSIILQLEPARKLFAKEIHNPYAIVYHTFFNLELLYEINPGSFLPPPTVQSAMLKIERKAGMVAFPQRVKYLHFVSFLLQKPDLPVRTAFKQLFRKSQLKEISEKHGIPMEPKVGCLSASQWEACFIEMLKMVPEKFHPVSSVGSIIDSP